LQATNPIFDDKALKTALKSPTLFTAKETVLTTYSELMAAAIRRFTGMNFTDLGKKVFESED
jgi:hypothetical protein